MKIRQEIPEKKFASRDNEPSVELPEDKIEVPDIQLEEVNACVAKLKCNKALGSDNIPVEQYKACEVAVEELLPSIRNIWFRNHPRGFCAS